MGRSRHLCGLALCAMALFSGSPESLRAQAAIVSTASAQDVRSGSGIAGERLVALPASARKLVLNVPGTITVRTDAKAKPQVRIRTDRNLLERIAVSTAVPGTVKIETSGSFRTSRELQIDVVLNGMSALDTAGSADVTVERIEEPQFELNVSGAGTIRATSGRARQLTIRQSGSADILASGLIATACAIESSGAGNMEVHCVESITGGISGAGEMVVGGKPKNRSIRASGASEIRFVN
jgi:hypothetical protein